MIDNGTSSPGFDSAEMGALAHLYRAEIYRSTVWRTRLDNTTNWAVVTTGIALSASFSNADASPLPLVIVGLLVIVFLMLEGRRYRYFHMYRARARLMETGLYGRILEGSGARRDAWSDILGRNYRHVTFQISVPRAIGRRLRHNYGWILVIQAVAYYAKLIIHPVPIASLDQLWDRAAIGPIPGAITILAGAIFHVTWILFAFLTLQRDERDWRKRSQRDGRSRD
jgi:uncharacterized membrane protein